MPITSDNERSVEVFNTNCKAHKLKRANSLINFNSSFWDNFYAITCLSMKSFSLMSFQLIRVIRVELLKSFEHSTVLHLFYFHINAPNFTLSMSEHFTQYLQ